MQNAYCNQKGRTLQASCGHEFLVVHEELIHKNQYTNSLHAKGWAHHDHDATSGYIIYIYIVSIILSIGIILAPCYLLQKAVSEKGKGQQRSQKVRAGGPFKALPPCFFQHEKLYESRVNL